MRIRLVALAIATIDAWLMFFARQAQAVDTSVWIALIAGVVGILTLLIQTYGQFQLAKIKDKQTVQAAAITEVHTLVDGSNTKQLAELASLRAEVALLKGVASERAGADAQAMTFAAGVKEGKGK